MRETPPAFTVVVPLYNAERYIAATIDSVLAQTCADFEVVVVDDASSDSGPSIVAGYLARDPRIRMVRQENRGLAGARNTGIRNARGRYIALLDADDLWAPRKLELHKAHFDREPTLGVSFAPSLFVDETGAALGLAQTPRLDDIDAEHIFCRNPVGNGSAAVLRRRALAAVAFEIDAPEGRRICWFDETFRQSEDIELWTRIAATTAWRFGGIAEPLTYYRVNNGGLSADVEKQFASWARFRAKLEGIAPALVAKAGQRAEAYQRRYLARRAAIGGHGAQGVRLMTGALRCHPRMLIEEPKRTLVTLALAGIACMLPGALFAHVKAVAFGTVSLRRRLVDKAESWMSRVEGRGATCTR